jgi:hypothetical protein
LLGLFKKHPASVIAPAAFAGVASRRSLAAKKSNGLLLMNSVYEIAYLKVRFAVVGLKPFSQ